MSLDILEVAARHPRAIALVADGVEHTFASLAERVRRCERRLAALNLLAHDARPVALVARPTLASLELVYALLRNGRAMLFIHARLPPSERAALAERVAAPALLAPDEAPIAGALAEPPALAAPAAEAPLAVIPTSGSSGQPKLALLSRRAFIAAASASQQNLPLGVGDRWLLCLPLAHVGGLSIVTRCLLAGASPVAFQPRKGSLLASPRELADVMRDSSVTHVSLVPAVLEALLRLRPEWSPPPSLRAVLLGGAATPPSLLLAAQQRGVPLLTTYGLTEACSQVTTTSASAPPRVDAGLVSSGKPLPGIELAIGDDARIRVRGSTLFSGFVGAAAPLDAAGWLTTEDRGFLGGDGELFVLGRVGDVIITGGEKVDPLRVEAVLGALPGVHGAAVFAVPDDVFGHTVAAALVTDATFEPATSSALLRTRLASYERPRAYIELPELPRLPNGKLNRAALRDVAVARLRPWSHIER